VSQEPPIASDQAINTIRHQRPQRWPIIALGVALSTFLLGAACFATLDLSDAAYFLVLMGTLGAGCGVIAAGVLIIVRNPTSAIRLGDDLDIGGLSFSTSEIARVTIAPDPQEDYCDEQGALRRIEIRFRRIAHYRSVGLIATESDADLTAVWAAKFGIELVDCRKPPPPAQEVAV
jgi:hypothetical protein